MDSARIEERIEAVLPEVAELRHDLHAHPELAYAEERTAGKVLAFLGGLEGLEVRTGMAGTGLVAVLGLDRKGPCVALRADMDALPIEEESGVAWASRNPGRMHACGHDGHTAMLAGAAKVLHGLRERLEGPVKFIFQPAEEGGAGALRMCQEGVLADPPVAAIYGLHNNLPNPDLPLGSIVYGKGAAMAGTGTFTIEVIGVGGHAAFPHRSVDPVYIGACIVDQLQGIVARNVDPLSPAVVAVTRFHGGSSHNVIPGKAVLEGTFRALEAGLLEQLRDTIVGRAEGVAQAHGARVKIRCELGYPVLENDPRAEEVFLEIVRELGWRDRLQVAASILGGEDFAYFGKEVPAFFYFLPSHTEGREHNVVCHHPCFDFNDGLLPLGMRLHVETALRFARLWKA
ncbi:MAG: M20 metallopeptidase family protein [Oceanipulchritudo sp.]